MALISCPDCGNEVSDQAPACPKCGFPVSEKAASLPVSEGAGGPDSDTKPMASRSETVEDQPASDGRSVVPLLAGGIFLILLFAVSTDYGGLKTRLIDLTGNAPPVVSSEKMVRDLFIEGSDLFDPHSAKFRNLLYTDKDILKDTLWCGEVNAKNRMGAYVGWKRFAASKTDKGEIDVSLFSGTEDGVFLFELRCKGTYPAPDEIKLEKK